MKIKHEEITIGKENPFLNCKLKREAHAEIMTRIVDTYSDGFVFAINNAWGTGKTTFVKMWEKYLQLRGFDTVYFNAWENDFASNPLIPIISELKPLTKGRTNKQMVFKKIIEKGAILTKKVAPVVAKSLVTKYVVDADEVSEVVAETTKAAAEILKKEINDYAKKKRTIAEFKNELESFVKGPEPKKPLIFIIDELDRCRPNFSVELLEQLKHFFSVRGIVFILSIDKRHLASAIKGFYGSDQIDTEEYLRRFIDLEYSLPQPTSQIFCDYLYNYYSFDSFFNSEHRSSSEVRKDGINLKNTAATIFARMNSTLRQQEKIMGKTRLVLNFFKTEDYVFPEVLFLLVYLNSMHNDFYREIEHNLLDVQHLSDRLGVLFPNYSKDTNYANLSYLEACFLHMYNNCWDSFNRESLIGEDEHGNLVGKIKPAFSDFADVNNHLIFLQRNWRFSDANLRHLTKKISLLADLQQTRS